MPENPTAGPVLILSNEAFDNIIHEKLLSSLRARTSTPLSRSEPMSGRGMG